MVAPVLGVAAVAVGVPLLGAGAGHLLARRTWARHWREATPVSPPPYRSPGAFVVRAAVPRVVRRAAIGCFALCTLALPGLGLAAWGAWLVRQGFEGGEWAMVAVIGGGIVLGVGAVFLVLGLLQLRAGVALVRRDVARARNVANLAVLTGGLALVGAGLGLLSVFEASRSDLAALVREPALGVALLAVVCLLGSLGAQSILLGRAAAVLEARPGNQPRP